MFKALNHFINEQLYACYSQKMFYYYYYWESNILANVNNDSLFI